MARPAIRLSRKRHVRQNPGRLKKEDVEQRIAQGIESRVRGLDEEAADDAVKEAYETLLPKAKLKAQVPMLTEEIVRGERRLVTAEKTKR